MLQQPLVFSTCSNIQLLVHSPFPNTSTEATLGTLLLTVPHLCDLRDSISHHWSPGRSQFNFQVKQRISNFLRDGKYPKHVPLPTYSLTCRRYQLVGSFYGLGFITEHYISLPLALKILLNSSICCQFLASSTRLQNLLIFTTL